MKTFYRNTIDLTWDLNPNEQIKNISKEIVRHSDFIPNTLSYEDIDKAFKEWVENTLEIVQDGIMLPTIVLYSNQRFSEYMQSWKYTDENNNVRLNFKALTRENNPQHGTIVGETYNIPNNDYFTFKSIRAIDENGKEYLLKYKMKQPTPIDLTYKVSVFTNRYTTVNEFNEKVNKIFNGIHTYISPNGHFMSLILENIGDDSEYNIQDRQFFSQSINIKVRGYIIKEDDFKVEETPISTMICFEGENTHERKPNIELSEYDIETENGVTYKPMCIDINITKCWPYKGKIKFTIDEHFKIKTIDLSQSENIIKDKIKLYINDTIITNDLYNNYENISFNEGDEIIIQIQRIERKINNGIIILNGYNDLL
jgi:hypothetical protein